MGFVLVHTTENTENTELFPFLCELCALRGEKRLSLSL